MHAALSTKQIRSWLGLVVVVRDRFMRNFLLGSLSHASLTTEGTGAPKFLMLERLEVIYVWRLCTLLLDNLNCVSRLEEGLGSFMLIQEQPIIAEKLVFHILAFCITD